MDKKLLIESGRTALGIEFGSTRVKAVLIGEDCEVISSGSYEWENQLLDGYWTYSLDEIHTALRTCYSNLRKDVNEKYGVSLKKIGAIGISGMMHGYMAFDKNGKLLTTFRTWRNTTTEKASTELTEKLSFNIPQRWTASHLYEAIIDGEAHVSEIAYVTTLVGYIHYMLTGVNAVGIGEASGIFPIDSTKNDYDENMVGIFDRLTEEKGFTKKLREVFPKVLLAGENAGYLTEKGVNMLDESGELEAGIPFAPGEGDAGTGMVATNSVRVKTGNISAGTSVFLMLVLEKALSKVYPEIDMVTTPSGKPVAMVHCNNCTSDINAWGGILHSFASLLGSDAKKGKVYDLMYEAASKADYDCGGLVSYNYYSGEPVTGFKEGRPLLIRTPDCKFTFENFMLCELYSAMATLRIGFELLKDEEVSVEELYGHGGFYIYPGVGQSITAAALDCDVSVMKTAGEGGPYGMALLALYSIMGAGKTLEDFLREKAFRDAECLTVSPDEERKKGFNSFLERYKDGLSAEAEAVKSIK